MLKHKIKHKDGTEISVSLTRGKAIKIFCTQCCGYEYHPSECEITDCALWPYRGKSLVAISNPTSEEV